MGAERNSKVDKLSEREGSEFDLVPVPELSELRPGECCWEGFPRGERGEDEGEENKEGEDGFEEESGEAI